MFNIFFFFQKSFNYFFLYLSQNIINNKMKTKLPPIKKNQILPNFSSPSTKVNFNLETKDLESDTKRPLLLNIELEKSKSFKEEDLKNAESPRKKILLNSREAKSMSASFRNANFDEEKDENEEIELDFDEGIFLLQKTFNLKTTEILQNLKVLFIFIIYRNLCFFVDIRIKTTRVIKYYWKTT